MSNKVFELKTPIDVYVTYAGKIPNSEIITVIFEKNNFFRKTTYKIMQVIPYVLKNSSNHAAINALLKSVAKRDKELAQLWIEEHL